MTDARVSSREAPRWRRGLTRMLISLLGVYLLAALALSLFQRRLIYFPTRLTVEVSAQLAAQRGFEPWTDPTGAIIGWKQPAPGRAQARVLVVHGNGGSALYRSYLTEPIRAAGAAEIYVLEYPGYGSRAGSPSQDSLLAAAEQALDQLPKDLPVHVVGESLGTGVAAHLARVRGDRLAGLLLFTPYDRLVSVGQAQMKFFPVGWMLRDRFEPARWLADYRGPVQFVLAGADEIIPTRFGQRLHDGYAGRKRLVVIPEAGHNEVGSQSADWWREVFAFWAQTP